MVSRSEPCPIAVAKELWEAIDAILVKHGSKIDKNLNIDGIAIFAFDGEEGMSVTMLGKCSHTAIIKALVKLALQEGRMVAIPVG